MLFFWLLFILLVCAVGIPLLRVIFWLMDKYLLHGKFKKKQRVWLSVAVPLVLSIVLMVVDSRTPYNTDTLNDRLGEFGMQVELPKYKIVDYKERIDGDYLQQFELRFKGYEILDMIPLLDSLSAADERWTKVGEEYLFHQNSQEDMVAIDLTLRPKLLGATCVFRYW